MNEFGVVTLAALCSMPLAADGAIWPDAAGEVAARYRPKGKIQPQMSNKRFMDMCSQLTQDTGHSEGAAAIMLVLHDDAKHDMACRKASRHESRHFHPGLVRRGEEGRVDRHQQEERLEAHFSVLIALLKNSGRYVRSGSLADMG